MIHDASVISLYFFDFVPADSDGVVVEEAAEALGFLKLLCASQLFECPGLRIERVSREIYVN